MKYLHIKLFHGRYGYLILRKNIGFDANIGDFAYAPLFTGEDTFRVINKKRDYGISDPMSLEFDRRVSEKDCKKHIQTIKNNGWLIYRYGGFWKKRRYGINLKDRIKSILIRSMVK